MSPWISLTSVEPLRLVAAPSGDAAETTVGDSRNAAAQEKAAEDLSLPSVNVDRFQFVGRFFAAFSSALAVSRCFCATGYVSAAH